MLEKYIVGIDEVGRGPLAGPISFGFVRISEKNYIKLKKDRSLPKKGFDSKKLTKEKREIYFDYLTKLRNLGFLDFCITNISNTVIDKKGISFAIKDSIKKGLLKIKASNQDRILLDGGLKAPLDFISQKTIIKGDEKEKVISWASIAAKVSRDYFMEKQNEKYPQYGFDKNVGYGTKVHIEAIKKYGITEIHRKSFID